MSDEELIDIIARSIFNGLKDYGISLDNHFVLSYEELPISKRTIYETIAHDVIGCVDDYYDNEIEDLEDDLDEEELIDEDPYSKHDFNNWWE